MPYMPIWLRELVVLVDVVGICAVFGLAVWKGLGWWERRR